MKKGPTGPSKNKAGLTRKQTILYRHLRTLAPVGDWIPTRYGLWAVQLGLNPSSTERMLARMDDAGAVEVRIGKYQKQFTDRVRIAKPIAELLLRFPEDG